MSREVRRVPAGWKHPRDYRGRYVPLHDGFTAAAARWDEENAKWCRGEYPDYADDESKSLPYAEWDGERPVQDDYMPDWPAEERTHLQMYETTSEGTPISPVMANLEALARWLADNGASAFAGSTATYEQWLSTCRRGWAPTAMIEVGQMMSGVEFVAGKDVG